MGLERTVDGAVDLAAALQRLRAGGLAVTLAMVDGALVMPDSPPPPTWSEVRVRTPAGMVTIRRRLGGASVIVFGNADPALQAAQAQIAAALGP